MTKNVYSNSETTSNSCALHVSSANGSWQSSQTHLSNIEHCHVKINLKLLLRIANAFGCTMENIFDARTFPESAEAKAASAKAHKTSGQEVYMREEGSRFCRCCIYIKIERHKQKKRLSVKE